MQVSLVGRFKTLCAILFAGSLAACGVVDDGLSQREYAVEGEPDQVLAWNATAVSALSSQNPLYQTRFVSIVQASVYDAVNSVMRQYEPYSVQLDAPEGATANAAAAGAAHYVLTHLTTAPPLSAAQQALIASAWDNLPASIKDNPGIALGEAVAAQILAQRASDGAPLPPLSPYTAPNSGEPGVWVAVGGAPALAPTWGNVTPWVLNSATQFYPEPPPALDSDVYLRDLAEVRDAGSAAQTAGTDRWNIAKFWITSAPIIFNPIARNLAVTNDYSLSQKARLLAQLNVIGADAAIGCWHAKFHYNFWRPITAIRAGGDATWQPLVPTPPFPEYLSGHSMISGAMATYLGDTFGDNPGVPILATSPTAVNGFSRSWTNFGEAIDEVVSARVWSGIHYRNTDEVGAQFGRKIAHYIERHAFRDNQGHTPD